MIMFKVLKFFSSGFYFLSFFLFAVLWEQDLKLEKLMGFFFRNLNPHNIKA